MNEYVKINLDLSMVAGGVNYYSLIGEAFGFFDGFGENWHATLDCLRSAREESDGMLKAVISEDQKFLLQLKGLAPLAKKFPNSCYSIILLIEEANLYHYREYGNDLIDLQLISAKR